MENLQQGLMLMGIGMLTVFTVLLIIINLSKVLISIVNKVAPEEETKPKAKTAAPAAIPQDVMEIISQTVNKITKGKGTVVNVTRV